MWLGSRLAPSREFSLVRAISSGLRAGISSSRQPRSASRPSTTPCVTMPMHCTDALYSASAWPTSCITPESVPPVKTHAFVACAAFASPCLNALLRRGGSTKSCAPPVIEMSTLAGDMPQCFSIMSSVSEAKRLVVLYGARASARCMKCAGEFCAAPAKTSWPYSASPAGTPSGRSGLLTRKVSGWHAAIRR